MSAGKRQLEPLDPIVAGALFTLLVVLVVTIVGSVIFASWQILVGGIGLAVIAFGYACLAQVQRSNRDKD